MKTLFILLLIIVFLGCGSKRTINETFNNNEKFETTLNQVEAENSNKSTTENNKQVETDFSFVAKEITEYGVFEDSNGDLHVYPKTKTKIEAGDGKQSTSETNTLTEENNEGVLVSNKEVLISAETDSSTEELKEPPGKKTAYWLGFITVPVLVILFLLLYFKLRK